MSHLLLNPLKIPIKASPFHLLLLQLDLWICKCFSNLSVCWDRIQGERRRWPSFIWVTFKKKIYHSMVIKTIKRRLSVKEGHDNIYKTVFFFFSPSQISHIVVGFQVLCYLTCTHALILSSSHLPSGSTTFFFSGQLRWCLWYHGHHHVINVHSCRHCWYPPRRGWLDNAAKVNWRFCHHYLMKGLPLKVPEYCLCLISYHLWHFQFQVWTLIDHCSNYGIHSVPLWFLL